jgi:hypothetical protein
MPDPHHWNIRNTAFVTVDIPREHLRKGLLRYTPPSPHPPILCKNYDNSQMTPSTGTYILALIEDTARNFLFNRINYTANIIYKNFKC